MNFNTNVFTSAYVQTQNVNEFA